MILTQVAEYIFGFYIKCRYHASENLIHLFTDIKIFLFYLNYSSMYHIGRNVQNTSFNGVKIDLDKMSADAVFKYSYLNV